MTAPRTGEWEETPRGSYRTLTALDAALDSFRRESGFNKAVDKVPAGEKESSFDTELDNDLAYDPITGEYDPERVGGDDAERLCYLCCRVVSTEGGTEQLWQGETLWTCLECQDIDAPIVRKDDKSVGLSPMDALRLQEIEDEQVEYHSDLPTHLNPIPSANRTFRQLTTIDLEEIVCEIQTLKDTANAVYDLIDQLIEKINTTMNN